MDLVRVQVEVLEPGAVIAGNTNIAMYLNPPRPFVSWPSKPLYELHTGFDHIVVKEMTARLHIQTMGTSMDLITLGDLDFLLTLHTEEELFDPYIGAWVALAVKNERPIKCYRSFCKIAVFDTSIRKSEIKFAGWLPQGEALRAVLEK